MADRQQVEETIEEIKIKNAWLDQLKKEDEQSEEKEDEDLEEVLEEEAQGLEEEVSDSPFAPQKKEDPIPYKSSEYASPYYQSSYDKADLTDPHSSEQAYVRVEPPKEHDDRLKLMKKDDRLL